MAGRRVAPVRHSAGAWGFLLRHHPATTVAPFSLLVPVFGMSPAFLFRGEPVSPLRWCAAALLVGGVALTSLTLRRTAPVVTAPVVTPAPTAAPGTSRPASRAGTHAEARRRGGCRSPR